jgi:hypothetical protein
MSFAALLAIAVRLVWPDLKIDAISLGLALVGVLPWLSPLIKSAEIPGLGRIEFQDVKSAAESVVPEQAEPGRAKVSAERREPEISDEDPNLALVELRIEIEKRLRAIAEAAGIARGLPLQHVTVMLQQTEVLPPAVASGLRDLIELGNQAAHGADVSRAAARFAKYRGPEVLAILDAKLAQLTDV